MTGAVGIFLTIPEMSTIARWSSSVLLALSGLGMAMDGIFTLESFFPHFIGFILGAGVPVVGFLVTGFSLRRIPHWRRFGSWLLLGSPLTLALMVLYFLTFAPTAEGAKTGIAGLTERILVLELAAWCVAMGWKSFQQSRQ